MLLHHVAVLMPRMKPNHLSRSYNQINLISISVWSQLMVLFITLIIPCSKVKPTSLATSSDIVLFLASVSWFWHHIPHILSFPLQLNLLLGYLFPLQEIALVPWYPSPALWKFICLCWILCCTISTVLSILFQNSSKVMNSNMIILFNSWSASVLLSLVCVNIWTFLQNLQVLMYLSVPVRYFLTGLTASDFSLHLVS